MQNRLGAGATDPGYLKAISLRRIKPLNLGRKIKFKCGREVGFRYKMCMGKVVMFRYVDATHTIASISTGKNYGIKLFNIQR
jgi:hypothetical protein